MKRHVFRLRVRLHDWMWSSNGRPARLARRLPLYFSDPYYYYLTDDERAPAPRTWTTTGSTHTFTFKR